MPGDHGCLMDLSVLIDRQTARLHPLRTGWPLPLQDCARPCPVTCLGLVARQPSEYSHMHTQDVPKCLHTLRP